jgi:hypothetical protein
VLGRDQAASSTAKPEDDHAQPSSSGQQQSDAAAGPGLRSSGTTGRRVAGQLVLLACYLAAGVAVSWPRAAYLRGTLPRTQDAGSYVWGFWWMARQVTRLANPWHTGYLAAPAGVPLGFHALMPLPGVLMTPVTLAFGPAFSYNLLSVAMPGLLCYAMYRAARLWVPGIGAIAAGAFFGLSSMMAYQSWYHLNLAAGALAIPVALEAAVRLRRRPGPRQAVILGVVAGASLLTDQESTFLVAIALALALAPWLVGRPGWTRLRALALAGLVAAIVAAPQIVAMAQQARSGGAASPQRDLVTSYVNYGVTLPSLFAPSPRVMTFGLTSLGSIYHFDDFEAVATFGTVLTVLAAAGLVVSWRRRSAWLLALLFLGCAALALGPVLGLESNTYVPAAVPWAGRQVSAIMPFTWFVHLPGMSGFREADRFTELGLVPAALLAGAAVAWLRDHLWPLLVVVAALAVLEAGWSGVSTIKTMPAAMPALDGPIAADHSRSIVVDVPFGVRGGTGGYGSPFPHQALVLATADGHPLAVGYVSRLPDATKGEIRAHPFYRYLVRAQKHRLVAPAQLAAARADARAIDVGWVRVWTQSRIIRRYLAGCGFSFDYRRDGVSVYWPSDLLSERRK